MLESSIAEMQQLAIMKKGTPDLSSIRKSLPVTDTQSVGCGSVGIVEEDIYVPENATPEERARIIREKKYQITYLQSGNRFTQDQNEVARAQEMQPSGCLDNNCKVQ